MAALDRATNEQLAGHIDAKTLDKKNGPPRCVPCEKPCAKHSTFYQQRAGSLRSGVVVQKHPRKAVLPAACGVCGTCPLPVSSLTGKVNHTCPQVAYDANKAFRSVSIEDFDESLLTTEDYEDPEYYLEGNGELRFELPRFAPRGF